MASSKIRKGDTVVVLSGKDKGRTGEVTKAMPKQGKVIVSALTAAAPPQADPGQPAGRHRAQGSAAAHFERRDRDGRRQADTSPL